MSFSLSNNPVIHRSRSTLIKCGIMQKGGKKKIPRSKDSTRSPWRRWFLHYAASTTTTTTIRFRGCRHAACTSSVTDKDRPLHNGPSRTATDLNLFHPSSGIAASILQFLLLRRAFPIRCDLRLDLHAAIEFVLRDAALPMRVALFLDRVENTSEFGEPLTESSLA